MSIAEAPTFRRNKGIDTFFYTIALSRRLASSITVEREEAEKKERSHINHDRSRPDYNSKSNIEMLTRREHYLKHYSFHKLSMQKRTHGDTGNGLNRAENIKALNLIWHRMSERERRGLSSPPIQQRDNEEYLMYGG